MSETESVKILYIAGTGRSGSTILSQVLGEMEGVVSVGELAASVWEYGLLNNRICGCGVPFRECGFWRSVIEKAYGGFEAIDPAYLVTLWRQVARFGFLPFMGSSVQPGDLAKHLPVFLSYIERLYWAIQQTTGCQVIVDSSKSPVYARLFQLIPAIDLRLLHLVRDSRAVAFSMARKRLRPEFQDTAVYLERKRSVSVALKWMLYHVVLGWLSANRPHQSVRIRYEDFVARPLDTTRRVCDLAEVDSDPVIDAQAHRVELVSNHQINGNPVRFKNGKVDLREDDEWKQGLPRVDRLLVSVLTGPLLAKFGYLK